MSDLPTSPEYGDCLATPMQFVNRYPHLYKTVHRLRWVLRDRQQNGLMDSGAIVEVFATGERPKLFIHVPSWFAWMRAGGSRAPRTAARG